MVDLTEKLPSMAEARTAPVRPLDGFEQRSLARLVEGDDVVVHESTGRLRLLGAIRAVQQCLACHEGPRGALLGAFSYRFARPGAPAAAPNEPAPKPSEFGRRSFDVRVYDLAVAAGH